MSREVIDTFYDVVREATMDKFLRPTRPGSEKPGEYYMKKVLDKDKQILKNLTSNEAQKVRVFWL